MNVNIPLEQSTASEQNSIKGYNQCFQLEDENYHLKDLDSGQVRDLRSDSIFNLLDSPNKRAIDQPPSIDNGESWDQFWKDIHQTHFHLSQACQDGKLHVVKELLDPGYQYPIDVNMKLEDQWCALHYAIIEDHQAIVEILLENGANPNIANIHGKTALHIAAIRGNKFICQSLIKSQSNLDLLDKEHQTALHYASYYGNCEIVDLLLFNKAQHDIKNLFGKTALEVALSKEVFDIFLQYNILRSSSNCDKWKNRNYNMNFSSVNQSSPKKQSNQEKPVHRIRKVEILFQDKMNKIKSSINDLTKSSSSLSQQYGPQDFITVQCLGKGGFGQVYLVRQKNTQNFFAMKVMNKLKVFDANMDTYAQTERQVLSVVNSPFIVNLYYAFQTQNKLYLVMSYCPGGDLEQMLFRKGSFKQSIVKLYIAEIILALEALHDNCIIFRDLKPSNVVIDSDGHACLVDFGLSKKLKKQELTKSFCGSMLYLAPEMLERKGHTFTLDWYLLGVLTYELLDGYPPFYDKDPQQLFDNIKKGNIQFPKGISDDCIDLLKRLLERNPQRRLGAKSDAREVKSHPFFFDVDWNLVAARGLNLPKPKNNLKQYLEYDESEIRVTFSQNAQNTMKINQSIENHINNWSFVNQYRDASNASFNFRN